MFSCCNYGKIREKWGKNNLPVNITIAHVVSDCYYVGLFNENKSIPMVDKVIEF